MALQEEIERQGLWLFQKRSFLPVGILLAALAQYYFDFGGEREPNFARGLAGPTYETGCFLVSLLGLFIRIYTVGHSAKNTSGRNTTEGQVADSLNTTGIYSTVRHPLYVGNFFMWLGPALLTMNGWFIVAFILFYWLYYEKIMYAEEQFLRRKFGETYLAWAEHTPAFIPRFGSFTESKYSFSWKKVILKEKAGLLNLFIVFLLFHLVDTAGEARPDYNYFFIYGTVAALVYYIVVKILSKSTNLFEDYH